MHGDKRLRIVRIVAALEAYAIAEFFALVRLGHHTDAYVTENHGGKGLRALLFGLPVAAALVTGIVAHVAFVRVPRERDRYVRWVELLSPVLVLWPLPALLFRGVFGANELFLMLLTGAMVWGLERALSNLPVPFFRGAPPSLGRLSSLNAPWLPTLVASLLVACMFAFACHGSIRIHDKMLTSNFDFGLFENLFWNTLHGRHGFALERPYFGEHAEYLLYVLLPVYALVPRSETLLVLQSAFIVGAGIPLYFLARRWLRSPWQAVVLVVVYLAFPTVQGCVFYDFHFLPLSVFFVLWAALFYAQRRYVGFWIAAFLAATCREDVALGLAAVGFALVLVGRTKKLGAGLAVLGSVWFVYVKFFWMQRFGNQVFLDYYADLVPPGARGFEAVVQTLVANPVYALSRILTEDKLLLALHLLVPLAFVPIRRAGMLILFLPGLLVVGLATNRSAITQFQFHYSMHFVPYLFVAAVVTLALRRRWQRWPALASMLLGSLICAVQYDAFNWNTFHTSFQEVSFDWSKQDERRLANFEALARQIPPNAAVSAGEYEGPHLSHRTHLRSVKEGLANMDYAIYSPRSLRWGGDEPLLAALRSGEFGVVETRGDMTLLKRGADTSKNIAAVQRIEHHR
jgi:uncharacterized membrane protein